jgi:hypothetical protein
LRARAWLSAGLALATLSCGGPQGEELSFSLVTTCLFFPVPTERVFRTTTEWTAAHRPGQGAPPIDFASTMVAAHFDGEGSACTTFSVERVTVEEGFVVVRATRHASTLPCILIIAYPQVSISLPRREEPVRFVFTDVRGDAAGPARACY